MAVRKYCRTLVVTEPTIELWPGIYLPIGHYDVIDEQLVLHPGGRSGEAPGRLMLKMSRKDLIAYGADLSGTPDLSLEKDIRSYVGRPGVRLR